MRSTLTFADDVDVFHHRGNRGVVAQTRDVLADFADRLVELAHHQLIGCAIARHRLHRRKEAIQKAAGAGDARIPEVAALLVRSEEHQVRAE